jgi:hypothetical protein
LLRLSATAILRPDPHILYARIAAEVVALQRFSALVIAARVAIVDMDTYASVVEIIRHTWKLGIIPGGAVAITQLDDISALPSQRAQKRANHR